MASFIPIPLKKTSEIDLVKPLKYIFSGFCVSADEPVNYDDALTELNKLRMNSTWRTLDKHENSLDVMTKYYDQLNFLNAKCPNMELQVPFKWKDAFDKGSFFLGSASLTLSTLEFERTCILFNIAAMQSQVACSHISDTKNDDGLKLAAKYFQTAAGTFLEVRTLAKTLAEPTPDMRADTLQALSALMLAQAQEAFFFKATADKMKDAVIAKVASRAEELYADALKQMQRESVAHLWEREWIPMVAGKQSGLLALSEYYQSLVCKSKKDVGEEIARLKKALDTLRNAEPKAPLPSEYKEYLPRITHNHDEAKKDNDFIYHARVPDANSLQPVGKAPLAKPFYPGPQTNADSQDLFKDLLPMAVQQAMSAFELRKMEIVNGEKGKLQSETQMLNGILASLNLPAAIEDTSGNSLPQSLRDKAQAIQEKGGMEALQKFFRDLPDLLKRNNEIITEIDRLIKEEEDTDNELRAKYGSQKWTRISSAKLNTSLKENVSKFSHILQTATTADTVVKEKFEKHRERIALLCLPEDQLVSGIPAGNPVTSCSSVDQLRALMRDVEGLKAQREALIAELESPVTDMKAKFLSALSAEGGVNENELSMQTLMEIYGPIQARVRDNLSSQERLVQNIQAAHGEFSKEKNGANSAGQRDSILSELASAHDAYMELLENLKEGTTFYDNLTEVLVNFQSKVSDFCFARRTEKEEIHKDLQRDIVADVSKQTGHSIGAVDRGAYNLPPVKPARPPPPQTSGPATAPPTNMPPAGASLSDESMMNQQQQQQFAPYPAYSYPYPMPSNNPYNPYGQIPVAPMYQIMPPTGYQGQPMQHPYPYPHPQQPAYPYPTQQYRPYPQ